MTAGYLNIGNLPYTEAVDELMEGFIHYQAQVFKNGDWTKPSSWDVRRFDFGPEIGMRDCYSMFFEEMRCLPEMYPTLRNTGFYISGSNWLADLLVTPVVMIGLKFFPKRFHKTGHGHSRRIPQGADRASGNFISDVGQ